MAGIARHRGQLSPGARALAADPSNIAIAKHVAWKYSARAPWLREDLVSAALLGLCEAARSFDPGRGLRFWTHARRRVVGEVLDEMRESGLVGGGRASRDYPLVCPIDAEDFEHPPADEGPVGWAAEWEDRLAGLARGLPARHRRVILALYGDCRASTMARAARVLGTAASNVSRLAAEAHAMIRRDELERRGRGAS